MATCNTTAYSLIMFRLFQFRTRGEYTKLKAAKYTRYTVCGNHCVWSTEITLECCTRYSTHSQVDGCGLPLSCFKGHTVTRSIVQQLTNGLALRYVFIQ